MGSIMFLCVHIAVLTLLSDSIGLAHESHAETADVWMEGNFKRSPREEGKAKENEKKSDKGYEGYEEIEEIADADEDEEELEGEEREKMLRKILYGDLGTLPVDPIDDLPEGVTKPLGKTIIRKSAYENFFSDSQWYKQWYLQDYRTEMGPVMDLNVVPVYKKGYTGEGIYVAVVDTGVRMDHEDLVQNLVRELAFSTKHGLNLGEPTDHGGKDMGEEHGTFVAGVIAMQADNRLCGAGIAHKAKLVAINAYLNSGEDHLAAKALSWARDKVDIYSNSWGQADTGMNVDRIGYQTAKAIDIGVTQGRRGLGSIFIFAGGNGRKVDDNCSVDAIVNYIHTIAIASATPLGKRGPLSEHCSALFATTYSAGPDGYHHHTVGVTATKLAGGCTNHFGGTRAAVPLASGIIALVLQARNELTYRDVMHIITMGAEVAPLADNHSWYKNGAGFWVSNEFGFGLMNALNMVNLAIDWTQVPEKTICQFHFHVHKHGRKFKLNKPAIVTQKTDGCQRSADLEERVFVLEQIILTCTIKHRYRGAISITLKSPQGTTTEVLIPRIKDKNQKGLEKWKLKSVHNWGEDPNGEWELRVTAKFESGGLSNVYVKMFRVLAKYGLYKAPHHQEVGEVEAFSMELHGTREKPAHHENGGLPRRYSAFRTADGQTSRPVTSVPAFSVPATSEPATSETEEESAEDSEHK